jgi:hypothetical protein
LPLVLLIVGAVFVVAAIRNTQGGLFAALGTDAPPFVIWFAALFLIGAIGFIPGLRPVSRGLLALILIVLVLNNYQAVIAGFQNATGTAPKTNSGIGSLFGVGGSTVPSSLPGTGAGTPARGGVSVSSVTQNNVSYSGSALALPDFNSAGFG